MEYVHVYMRVECGFLSFIQYFCNNCVVCCKVSHYNFLLRVLTQNLHVDKQRNKITKNTSLRSADLYASMIYVPLCFGKWSSFYASPKRVCERACKCTVITPADINAYLLGNITISEMHSSAITCARQSDRHLSRYPTVRGHPYRSLGHLFLTRRQERRRIETDRRQRRRNTYVSGDGMQEALEVAAARSWLILCRVKAKTVDRSWISERAACATHGVIDNKVAQSINFNDDHIDFQYTPL